MAGENTSALNCSIISESSVKCGNIIYEIPEEKLTYLDEWFWIYLGIYVALVLFAGLVSGLTMGLLSIDTMSLKVLQAGGTPSEKKHAARILPLVTRHHLLLVTLLLANAAAVESMPLFLDRISDPITAICVSVSAVLLFGEVFPQALCTRYGLAIGATLSPFVYLMMALFFVIAWPLSKLLDLMLGKDHATFFRRAELKALVDLHGTEQGADNEEPLSIDEVLIIKGALEMRDKVVKDAMVPLESVYMLDVAAKMNRDIMTELIDVSHSRIPIFEGDQQNIIGIILLKNLITLDPDDEIPVRHLVETSKGFRRVPCVPESQPLYATLNEFQTGKSHLSLVRKETRARTGSNDSLLLNPEDDQPKQDIIGIITLEDVLEELIQEEIVDETDVYVDVHKRIQVARARVARLSSEEKFKGLRPQNASQPQAGSSSRPVDPYAATTPLLDEQENVAFA